MLIDAAKPMRVDDRDTDGGSCRGFERLIQRRGERGPIHQTGKRVLVGQLPDRLISSLYCRLHQPQTFSEYAKFIAPLNSDRHVVSAAPDLIDRSDQLLQRLGDAAR